MIQYLHRKDINDKQWDDCIAQAANGLPYAYSWYLDIVAGNWDALVVDDYRAVFPLPFRRKWGVSYLYQPFFAQQLGIFFVQPPPFLTIAQILAGIPERYAYIEMNVNYANHFEHPDFKLTERLNLQLPLDKPYEEIKGNYNHNLRRNLQKAAKQKLQLVESRNAAEAVGFFKKETGTHIENLKEKDYQTLARLAEMLMAKGLGNTYAVTNAEGVILATALFIHSHNRLINLLPAANKAGMASGATAFLFDELIKDNAGSGKIFDFEGSMIPGVARFYQSFGAQEVHYWQLKRKKLPWHIKLFKR